MANRGPSRLNLPTTGTTDNLSKKCNMLCSILLPTRRRLAKLKRCIQSIVTASEDKSCFEIVLRLHRDDPETVSALPELLKLATVQAVIGISVGYGEQGRMYTECANLARGQWIWIMNDDVLVEGTKWDSALQSEPTSGVIAFPELHRLGGSGYPLDMGCPFMFVPNGCWKTYGCEVFQNPIDTWLRQLLLSHNWNGHFLPGLTIWHDWHPDENLVRNAQQLLTTDLH